MDTVKAKTNLRYPEDKYESAGEFIRKIGGWKYYYDWVKMNPVRSNKIGRNAPCPCKSGKKYKKCCMK